MTPLVSSLFASRRARRRTLGYAALLALCLLAAALLVRWRYPFLTDADALRGIVAGFGAWAPAALVALQALQVVFAPVPGQVLGAVGGYLFGPLWGTAYNVAGVTIGSAAAFWLSRRFGRRYVERAVDPDALAAFDGFADRHGLLTLFVAFLVPGLPDDALCFVGGLTDIPLWRLVLVAAVGRAPGFLLLNVFGSLVASGRLVLATGLLVALSMAAVLGYLYRNRLARLLER